MDRLNDLRLFIDAAALGSFSAAGRKNGLSAAASSATIQRLETALGVQLFERSTRRLRLTEEGEAYRHYGLQALESLAEAEQVVSAGRREVRGTLRLSAPSDLGRNALLVRLDSFQQQHPQVKLALRLDDTPADLLADDIDLAIRYGQPRDSRLVARLLASSRRVVCAAPALLARVGMPTSPDALAALPTLVLVTATGPMQDWRWRHGEIARSVRVGRSHESNDGDVLRRWAIQGRGFAYKSLLDVQADLQDGRLVTVLDEHFTDAAPLHALYHPHAFQPQRLKLLVAHLQDAFGT